MCFAELPIIYALHINGIDTTIDEARTNAALLASTVNCSSNMVQFTLIYNPTASSFVSQFI
jgi:hypothetical protein